MEMTSSAFARLEEAWVRASRTRQEECPFRRQKSIKGWRRGIRALANLSLIEANKQPMWADNVVRGAIVDAACHFDTEIQFSAINAMVLLSTDPANLQPMWADVAVRGALVMALRLSSGSVPLGEDDEPQPDAEPPYIDGPMFFEEEDPDYLAGKKSAGSENAAASNANAQVDANSQAEPRRWDGRPRTVRYCCGDDDDDDDDDNDEAGDCRHDRHHLSELQIPGYSACRVRQEAVGALHNLSLDAANRRPMWADAAVRSALVAAAGRAETQLLAVKALGSLAHCEGNQQPMRADAAVHGALATAARDGDTETRQAAVDTLGRLSLDVVNPSKVP